MKIGIVTYTHGTNFGQRLQNYALQKVLEDMGHDVYTIQQKMPYSKSFWIKYWIKEIVKIFIYSKKRIRTYKRAWLFRKFNTKYIKFYNKKLEFDCKDNSISKDFDLFIVGSDQVWNPYSDLLNSNFFLEFASSVQKKTYAPSLACDDKNLNGLIKYYVDNLSDFKNISVREDSGAEILSNILNKNIEVVVDPTLLLSREEWNMFRVNKKIESRYLLAIFLGEYPKNKIYEISCKTDLEICYINDETPISPGQFIDLIANACLVLTDSYHALIFAYMYEIPFLQFDRMGWTVGMLSRFKTLYRIWGIEKPDENSVLNMLEIGGQFNFGNKTRFMEYKDRSLNYLINELSSVAECDSPKCEVI